MLKGAIVGFGGVAANGHLPAYRECDELEICAVVDPSAERRADAESRGLRAYSSLDELASGETLDFVDVCTPPAYHAVPMFAALERGWHVLCEKPLLLDPTEYAEAVRLSRKHQRVVFPVHNWKYAPILRSASRYVQNGALGRIRRAEVRTYRVGHCKGKGTDSADWRLDPHIAGGGILIDHGWHAFYLVLEWLQRDPQNIAARVRRDSRDELEHEVDVQVGVAGGEGIIHLTWNATERRNTANIVGEDGEISIDDDRLSICTKDFTGEMRFHRALSAGSHHADWFAGMLLDFAREITDPNRSEQPLREAGWCMELTRSAYLSEQNEGEPLSVTIPEAVGDADVSWQAA